MWVHSPSPPVEWQGGPVPLAATKLPSHKATWVTLCHRSLTVTHCSGTTAAPVSQANLGDTSYN